jgi:Cys-rich protein (TIGR01571 family)
MSAFVAPTLPTSDDVIVGTETEPHHEAPRGSLIAQVLAYRRDPQMVLGSSKWSVALFGCFQDRDVFCEELLCSYCHIGYLYGYLETGERRMNRIACCGTFSADYLFVACGLARCSMVSTIRQRLVKRYDITESALATCFVSCCCSSCAMCQMHREMNHRWDTPGGILTRRPVVSAPMGLPYGDSGPHPQRVAESSTSPSSSEFSSTLMVRAAGIQPPLPRYGYGADNTSGYPAIAPSATITVAVATTAAASEAPNH